MKTRARKKLNTYIVSWLEEHNVTVQANDHDEANKKVVNEDYDSRDHDITVEFFEINEVPK